MTYEQALAEGRKIGASRAPDDVFMAMLCESIIQTLCGAVSPRLVWEGARRAGLDAHALMVLATDDPRAAADLMWTEEDP